MAAKRTILGWDNDCKPTIRDIDGALNLLASAGVDIDVGSSLLRVRMYPGWAPLGYVELVHTTPEREKVGVRFLTSSGCRARTLSDTPIESDTPIKLTLDKLDCAEVSNFGITSLHDGHRLQSVTFETVSYPSWDELDDAIAMLTICIRKAEHICIRRDADVVGVDFAGFRLLQEPNVKDLTRRINERICDLPRPPGKRPFGRVPVSRVQRTLNTLGVHKMRGRKAAASPQVV